MATAMARLRTIRIAPRKVRLVADLIRGKNVSEARDILLYTPKASAPLVRKLLESAVANAENDAAEKRERVDTDSMIVTSITVDEGPTIRRFRPAPRGRAVRIRKRTSNVRLHLSDETSK
ncbi:MAG: 50S ribosomal protein L22 [SAR324 cluster bacterium]|nr:50S ribosomal protein L22 [SAR324 cluster bacterium]